MDNGDWKKRLGVVYSTNPDFQYVTETKEEAQTLPPEKQRLTVPPMTSPPWPAR